MDCGIQGGVARGGGVSQSVIEGAPRRLDVIIESIEFKLRTLVRTQRRHIACIFSSYTRFGNLPTTEILCLPDTSMATVQSDLPVIPPSDVAA